MGSNKTYTFTVEIDGVEIPKETFKHVTMPETISGSFNIDVDSSFFDYFSDKLYSWDDTYDKEEQQFIYFLRKHKLMGEFQRNLKNLANQSIVELFEESTPEHYLDLAFPWDEDESVDWEYVNEKWMEEINQSEDELLYEFKHAETFEKAKNIALKLNELYEYDYDSTVSLYGYSTITIDNKNKVYTRRFR